MARPALYDDTLRQRLLDVAAGVIAAEGVDQLSLRQVATEAGTSTNAIYTLFGGKDQLVEGVVALADASFTVAQEAVGLSGDPRPDLAALGVAYRAWALAHPSLYAVMFAGRVPVAPPDCPPDETPASLVPLTTTVATAHDRGLLAGGDVADAVTSIWAMIHGLVSLEIAGHTVTDPGPHLDAIGRAWLRDGSVVSTRAGTPDRARP